MGEGAANGGDEAMIYRACSHTGCWNRALNGEDYCRKHRAAAPPPQPSDPVSAKTARTGES
jgi:hypothetical protein